MRLNVMGIVVAGLMTLAAIYFYNRFIADATKGESIATLGKPAP